VLKEIKDKYQEVAWAKIKGMRNILVHNYGNIQLKVIWNTVNTSITPLKEQIKKITGDINF
jgi:uncharacterized protein with HEPN domain